MARLKGTSAPATLLRILAYGPHPLSRALAGNADRATTVGLSGAGLVPGLRYGMTGGPVNSYRGDLGPQQDMRGGAFLGVSRNLRTSGENRALPSTSAAAGNPVLHALEQTMPLDSTARRA